MSEYTPGEWAPDEKPMLPGSPSTPAHLPAGILVAVTAGLGNALGAVNLLHLQGAPGAHSSVLLARRAAP